MTRRDRHQGLPAALQPLSRAVGRVLRDLEIGVQNARARLHPAPVFILGNQKSGTSIVASLLARLSGLEASIDLRREVRRPSFQRVVRGEQALEVLLRANRADFSRPIIKEPNLTHLAEPLADRFPDARFALVIRDPRDNLRSILNRLRLPGDLEALSPEQWRQLSPAWQLVVDGGWWGLDGDHYVDHLAERWNAFSDLHLERRLPLTMIRYEDFVADKVGSIESLAGALELERVADIAPYVEEQLQSRGERDAVWSEFFGQRNLARIETRCGARMRALGYRESNGSNASA